MERIAIYFCHLIRYSDRVNNRTIDKGVINIIRRNFSYRFQLRARSKTIINFSYLSKLHLLYRRRLERVINRNAFSGQTNFFQRSTVIEITSNDRHSCFLNIEGFHDIPCSYHFVDISQIDIIDIAYQFQVSNRSKLFFGKDFFKTFQFIARNRPELFCSYQPYTGYRGHQSYYSSHDYSFLLRIPA